jgi:hypothetical protein
VKQLHNHLFTKLTKLTLKRFLSFVLISSFTISILAQSPKVRKVQRKADKREQRMKTEAEKTLKEKKKRHFKMQSKRVQKQLKNNEQATASYYRWYNANMWFRNFKTRKNKHH